MNRCGSVVHRLRRASGLDLIRETLLASVEASLPPEIDANWVTNLDVAKAPKI